MKGKNTVATNCMGTGAAEPEMGSEIEVLRSPMSKHWFIPETLFNDLDDEYEFGSGSVLTEILNLV